MSANLRIRGARCFAFCGKRSLGRSWTRSRRAGWHREHRARRRPGMVASPRPCIPSCTTASCGHHGTPREETGSLCTRRACMSSRTPGRRKRGATYDAFLWRTCGRYGRHVWTMRIVKRGADQTIQQEGSVRLTALWFRGGAHESLGVGQRCRGDGYRSSGHTRSARCSTRGSRVERKSRPFVEETSTKR